MTISSALQIVFNPSSYYLKKPDSGFPRLLAVIAMTVTYVIFAKLSYFSTIPPGYASTIWPPAGIALAGLLIYGYRLWPGVLLGAFIANGLIPELTNSVSDILITLLTTLVISSGATLQALAGAYWLKRYAGFPNGLRREKSILLFMLYGGALSATINPTLSIAMLVATGKTPLANVLNNWLTWWCGDVLGVVIFTPLALAWLLKDTDSWRHRRFMITLPIVSMFALTAIAVIYETKSSNERIQLEFDQHVEQLNNALETSLTNQVHALHSIRSLFLTSIEVNKDEFRIFTQQLLTDYPDIQSISWAPLIQNADRDAFEKMLQKQGDPSFQITEVDAKQQRVPAKTRPQYAPVTFIEPYQYNNKVLNFDNLSNPSRLAAFNSATDSGDLIISPRIKLLQDSSQYGVLAVIPLYRKNLALQTLTEKRLAISSYVTAALKLNDMMTTALKHSNTHGLSYRLRDSTAPTAEQLLYSSEPFFPAPLVIQEKAWFSAKKTLSSRSALPFGGRVWIFEVVPKQDYFASHRSSDVWLVMLLSLLVTSLVSVFSLLTSGRTRILQQLVNERTDDIQQQHAQLLSLMSEKEKLSMALEQSQSAVMITDLDATIEYINQAFVNNTGYSREEIIGSKANRFKSGKTPKTTFESMWATLLNGNAWQGEIINMNKQGQEFIELTWISPIRSNNGMISHYLSVKENITERKKTESELTKLSMALEQSQSSVMITDLDATIEYVNQAFITSTGYSREEIIGQKPSLLKSNKTPRSTYDAMWAALLAGKAWQGEVINLNKQGEEFIELTWISPIRKANGEVSNYLGVKEDISERKQKDALLLAAKERAEHLAKTKSQFLANMSHEIRTPMNAIIGFSELALLKDMPTEVTDYLKNINTASNNLLVILNDILDLSKLEAGQMGLNLSPFSLPDLQATLHNLFIITAQSKGLALSINIASDVPDSLIGDSIRLRQVLTNLLGNAIKFTSQGAVTLNISLQQRDDQQARLLFAVTDTGIGISVEQQAKLFLPFSQVDDGYARNFEGTGLGLVISQDLVQLMGSLIKVESQPGLGSCFSVELALPIAPLSTLASIKTPSNTAPSVLHTETETLNGIKILVAEDDAFNQKIIQQVLKRLGASLIVLANDGSEALATLEQDDFDVVLMDLHMPIMNGFEAATEIRKRPRYAQLPVIALSASVTDEDRQRSLAAGMNDFIAKPINTNTLLSTLKQYLD